MNFNIQGDNQMTSNIKEQSKNHLKFEVNHIHIMI